MLAAIARWGSMFRDAGVGDGKDPFPGPVATQMISSYVLRVTNLSIERVASADAAVAQPRAWSMTMSTNDRLRVEGHELLAEARALGRMEGKAEGQAAICLRQLTARFGMLPEPIAVRLRSASEVDFDRWALRLLDAGSLAEVFANE